MTFILKSPDDQFTFHKIYCLNIYFLVDFDVSYEIIYPSFCSKPHPHAIHRGSPYFRLEFVYLLNEWVLLSIFGKKKYFESKIFKLD